MFDVSLLASRTGQGGIESRTLTLAASAFNELYDLRAVSPGVSTGSPAINGKRSGLPWLV